MGSFTRLSALENKSMDIFVNHLKVTFKSIFLYYCDMNMFLYTKSLDIWGVMFLFFNGLNSCILIKVDDCSNLPYRFCAAVPSRSGETPGELLAGGPDDRAHLEVHPLPWQTHLCTRLDTGQVPRRSHQFCACATCPFQFSCFSFLFLLLPLTLSRIQK